MKRKHTKLIICILAIVAIGLTIVANLPVSHPKTVVKPIVKTSELLSLINVERAKVGAKPLAEDTRLDGSAAKKANEMQKEGLDNTPHVSRTGQHGYSYAAAAAPECKQVSENLAWGFGSAADAVNLWMHSAPHRIALLNVKYDLIGVAISSNGRFAVTHFCDLG